jgi:hypothetical protein
MPDERRRFHVIGAATQGANRPTEVSGEGPQATSRQIGQQTPGNIPRADHVEWKYARGQRAEERLLESSEVNNRWRGLLRETGGLVRQLLPGALGIDSVPYHVVRDPRDPCNGCRNVLAVG